MSGSINREYCKMELQNELQLEVLLLLTRVGVCNGFEWCLMLQLVVCQRSGGCCRELVLVVYGASGSDDE
ncbi:hypothetical protein C5167_042886 [Papaver somniferum]|uniref:Uncharacterized protein n=1 Tax=Papaver somniferum TaxID=3469 RepID=A0A4Y7L5T3_PAPSO|nr:hypothetical protein C5167_042886 [Papaver somniferum]